MTPEQNKTVVQRFFDAMSSKGRPQNLDEVLDPGYVNHMLGDDQPLGRKDAEQFLAVLLEAFPDFTLQVQRSIAENDLVATQYTLTATHQGQFQGIAATGRSVRHTGTALHRVRDHRIVEDWPGMDIHSLLAQTSPAPLPATA